MTTAILRWGGRLSTATIMAIVALFLVGVMATLSSVSLGDLISEKLIGRAGVADSSLIIGRAGTDTTLHMIGFAPRVVSVAATNLGSHTATLNGTVSNMNGMPTSTAYFIWGYDPSSLPNTTVPFTVTTAGNYSTDLSGFAGSGVIYYQFMCDADGTNIGGVRYFPASGGMGGYLLKQILRVILALAICVGVLIAGRSGGIAMLVSAIVGLVAFIIINITLINLL